MIVITVREFSRNMRDISERVEAGESFLVSRNSEIIFEVRAQKRIGEVDAKEQLQKEARKKAAEINSLKKELNELLTKLNN